MRGGTYATAGVGLGYLRIAEERDITVSGAAGFAHLRLGAVLASRWVVFTRVDGVRITDPTFTGPWGKLRGSSRETSVTQTSFGTGVAYYPRYDVHVDASVLLARIGGRFIKDDHLRSRTGVGVQVAVGHAHWVRPGWAVGTDLSLLTTKLGRASNVGLSITLSIIAN